jgi:hypothetical protein
MKIEMLVASAAFFLMPVTVGTGVYAIEEKEKVVTVSRSEVDITGDGVKEDIYLKGVPYQGEDSYLKKFLLRFQALTTKYIRFR